MRRLIVLAAALACVAGAKADQLFLSDGSRLSGTVIGVSDASVQLETTYAGTIDVRLDAVEGIVTDQPRAVLLASGDRILGRLVWDRDSGQRIDSRVAGMVELEGMRFVAIEDKDATRDPVIAAREQADREIEALKTEHAAELAEAGQASDPEIRAKQVWSSNVSLAVSGSSGNTDEFTANPRFTALRETEFDRLSLGLRGRFASQDGEETENEVVANIVLERDVSPRWFVLGGVRLERDEFEDLDLRANVDLGAGYFVYRREDLEFKPRFGIGLQTEAFSNSENQEDLVGVLGWDYRNDIGARWRLTHTIDYRSTFSSPTSQYRVDSEVALTTALSEESAWQLQFLLRNEFNADPAPGIDRLDTVYSVGILRAFE